MNLSWEEGMGDCASGLAPESRSANAANMTDLRHFRPMLLVVALLAGAPAARANSDDAQAWLSLSPLADAASIKNS